MLKHFLELTLLIVRRELVIRYRGTVLGYLWSILNPLAFALVYFIAFRYILRIPVENYAIFVITGLFPWIWMSNSISSGTTAFGSFQGVVKNGYSRPIIIPFFIVFTEFVNFLFALPVIYLFVAISPVQLPVTSLIYFPVLALLTGLFLLGAVSIVSCLCLILRDLGHFTQLAVQMLFFLSPIIYPSDMVPEKFLAIYTLNPFVNMIELWRQLLYSGDVNLTLAIYPLIFSLCLLLIGGVCLKRIGSRAVQWL